MSFGRNPNPEKSWGIRKKKSGSNHGKYYGSPGEILKISREIVGGTTGGMPLGAPKQMPENKLKEIPRKTSAEISQNPGFFLSSRILAKRNS